MSNNDTLFQLPEHSAEPTSSISGKAKPRLNSPQRNQIEFINVCLDDLLPEDHQARSIWHYVDQMDLSTISSKIQSISGNPGRPAIDPKILLSLWIYAMVEGIGSARVIERYCSEHIGFKWICGGVSVNYHTIADFRRNNANEFNQLVTVSIARLMQRDLVTLKRVSQDGMRVRASAGSSSFRRKPKLKELLAIANEQLEVLEKEIDADPAACLNRQMAAKKRGAKERKERLEQAIEEHRKLTMEKGNAKKKQRKILTPEEKSEIRASMTDPKARKMKMGNGGFSPAYNVQLAVDTESRLIVGYDAINKNNDYGQLAKVFEQVGDRYNEYADEWLVDQGYLDSQDIIKVQKKGCKVYVNPSKVGKKDPNVSREGEDTELGEWRVRMGTAEAKEIYKDRASNSEWANAGMRNRGLRQLAVRGITSVLGVIGLQVLTHNYVVAAKFGYGW